MFSHPSQEQVQRDVPLAYVGPAWRRTRGRSSGADNVGKCWSTFRERLSQIAFSLPPGLRNSKTSKRPTAEFGSEEESPLHHPGK